VPMFRSYARFGVVVQLMAALLAGIGVERLRRVGTKRAQAVCVALVALAAGEYAVSPSALWRDVLPTTAHRWVVQQVDRVRVLDCTPLDQESESVQWLTGYRVTLLGGSISDCTEPNLSQKLAANGYTHLLVRRNTADGQWFADHAPPEGLRVAAQFDDGQVFAVTARTPAIYTATMTKFFPRERDVEWTWRWMGEDAAWTIVNTSARPIVATLGLEMSAFHRARGMALLLDGRHVQTLVVQPPRRIYQFGPLTVGARRADSARARSGRVERAGHTPHRWKLTDGASYFVAVIESTRIALVLASSVPLTVTFCAANVSGVRWSLSAYTSLPSDRTYVAPCSAMQATVHSASVGPIRIGE
jgi:hypothetical protein